MITQAPSAQMKEIIFSNNSLEQNNQTKQQQSKFIIQNLFGNIQQTYINQWQSNITSLYQEWKKLRDTKGKNVNPDSLEQTTKSQINSLEKQEVVKLSQHQFLDNWKHIFKSKSYRNDELQNAISYQNQQLEKYQPNKFIILTTYDQQDTHRKKYNPRQRTCTQIHNPLTSINQLRQQTDQFIILSKKCTEDNIKKTILKQRLIKYKSKKIQMLLKISSKTFQQQQGSIVYMVIPYEFKNTAYGQIYFETYGIRQSEGDKYKNSIQIVKIYDNLHQLKSISKILSNFQNLIDILKTQFRFFLIKIAKLIFLAQLLKTLKFIILIGILLYLIIVKLSSFKSFIQNIIQFLKTSFLLIN
ncbi:hypothetical protein ABPG72_009758 [Tetrahymena utriculariae]